MTTLDICVFRFFNQTLHCTPLTALMTALSTIGEHHALVIIAVVLLFGGYKHAKAGFLMLSGLVVSYYAYTVIKYLVGRPRPYIALPGAFSYKNIDGFSFPSGHSSDSFACAFILAGVLGGKYQNAYFAAAAMIALSRLYLGAHYPSDIIAGSLLGLGIGWLFTTLWNRMERNAGAVCR